MLQIYQPVYQEIMFREEVLSLFTECIKCLDEDVVVINQCRSLRLSGFAESSMCNLRKHVTTVFLHIYL